MVKKKKFHKKKKKKKKFFIEIRTNKGWKKVQLLKDISGYLLVKLPCGEIIKRRSFNKIKWGKTKRIRKKV